MVSKVRAQISDRAVAWLDAEIGRFDPFVNGGVPAEAEQTALVEVALVAMTLQRRSQEYADHVSIRSWLDAVEAAYARPGFHETIFRGHKHAFSGHLVIWLALSPGRNLPVSRDQIQILLDLDNVTLTERVPFRAIELRYLLDLGGFRHDLPELARLAERCFLVTHFNPVDALDQDVYALTHAAFYITDFGARDAFAGTDADYLIHATHMLLVMMVRRRHWDLVAELLLALCCFGAGEDPVTEAAWRALADAQEPDGAIPENPGGGCATYDDPHARFLAIYHRTLTVLLAAGLCQGSSPA